MFLPKGELIDEAGVVYQGQAEIKDLLAKFFAKFPATAKKMLDALAPPRQVAPITPAPTANTPQTDLVGAWQAKAGPSTVELTIGDDSQFTWKATQQGKPPLELKGTLVATADTLVLDNKEQGSMVGTVKSGGADKWQFVLAGSPPDDEGLTFARVR